VRALYAVERHAKDAWRKREVFPGRCAYLSAAKRDRSQRAEPSQVGYGCSQTLRPQSAKWRLDDGVVDAELLCDSGGPPGFPSITTCRHVLLRPDELPRR
jgi:hypothetical protein